MKTTEDKYSVSNLTRKEKEGLKSLSARIKEGEISIAASDKSSRFVDKYRTAPTPIYTKNKQNGADSNHMVLDD